MLLALVTAVFLLITNIIGWRMALLSSAVGCGIVGWIALALWLIVRPGPMMMR